MVICYAKFLLDNWLFVNSIKLVFIFNNSMDRKGVNHGKQGNSETDD
jgi:hypothetical protein